MYQQKTNPRTEYREHESQRVNESATLAEKFPNLNSLAASLTHFGPEGLLQIRAIKYTFNLAHAKSLFRFDCPNEECVGGDFDLSEELAQAVAAHRHTVFGQVVCQGWRGKGKDMIGYERCHNILRFKLSLSYKNSEGDGAK